jgi:hypothetical protein
MFMKLNIKLQLLMAGSLLISVVSCSKLKEQPYSSIFTDQFYKTASDAEAALTAAYSPMVDLYNTAATGASDFSSDQSYPRPVVGRDTYTLFSYDPNYTTQKSFSREFESPVQIWRSAYSGIEKANWVLDKVPATNMDTKRRDEILGEAFFLRAFYHWMLTKNFGDVVVKIKPSVTLADAVLPKSARADVYKQIYADLDQAVAKLPTYTTSIQKGRPSKEVALALYAKAALYNEDYATSLDKAKQVIASGKYTLMPDIRDVFNVAKEDAARTENMWAYECESTSPGKSSQIMSLYGPRNSDGPAYAVTSFGSAFAYQSFYNSFSPADKRRQLLDTNYINKSGQVVAQKDITPITAKGVLVKKYMDPNSSGGSGAINIPILRLSDIYLVAAEAEARQNGATAVAYSFINPVRQRAGLAALTASLAKDVFIAAVLTERSWELFCEGDRWYDLTRTNTFLQVIPAAVNDVFPVRAPQAKHRYFPIPLDEINANTALVQNDGWK